jgi:hypothetical protein
VPGLRFYDSDGALVSPHSLEGIYIPEAAERTVALSLGRKPRVRKRRQLPARGAAESWLGKCSLPIDSYSQGDAEPGAVARFGGLTLFPYLGFRCAVHYHDILYKRLSGHSLQLR